MSYVEDMRAEANIRREQAAATDNVVLKAWHMERAAFFDACANEQEGAQHDREII